MGSFSKVQVLVGLALFVGGGTAQTAGEWAQCGGTGWNGAKTCASGLVCNYVNDWYSQCIKGSTSAPPEPSQPTSQPEPTTPTTNPPVPAPTGFVKTSGTRFTLNGAKYTVVGSNSYWVGLNELSDADMNKAFADVAGAGGTTVRTWGFNEAVGTPTWGEYYQSWSGGKPTINTGAKGLAHFDKVVAAAKANGIRLIVALTNNWADYGGMDVYVNQIAGQGKPHDLFYTDPAIISAFQSYVKTFVGRYKNEPTILGWELANEPRCRGSTAATSGTCTPATITKWATTMGAFIKSVDSNHLVALGDEGFYNQPGHASYPYQGGEGIDFDANLKIPTMDFGTVHMYPEHWGETANAAAWGVKWINDHAASQKAANKPVILEEFGMTTASDKATIYPQWFSAIQNSGLAGDLIWQAGSHYSWGSSHDDGYAVYPDSPSYKLLTDHARAMKARA